MGETILDPTLPIIDPHHHLWDRTALFATQPPPKHEFERLLRLSPRYLLDELLADMNRGHNVIATVYMECGAMYRAGGPSEMRPVGETEFVNGFAAISASAWPKIGAKRVTSDLREPGRHRIIGRCVWANASRSASLAKASATTGWPTKSQVIPAAVI